MENAIDRYNKIKYVGPLMYDLVIKQSNMNQEMKNWFKITSNYINKINSDNGSIFVTTTKMTINSINDYINSIDSYIKKAIPTINVASSELEMNIQESTDNSLLALIDLKNKAKEYLINIDSTLTKLGIVINLKDKVNECLIDIDSELKK